MVKRVGDLELDQDLGYQQAEWRAERISWVIWAFLLLAVAIGLLGPGVASQRTAADEGGALRAEYNRFVRHHAPSELRLHIDPALARNEVVSLQLDQEYLDRIKLDDIVPKPDQEQAMGDRVIYTFAVAETEQPLRISFRLEPDKMGSLSTTIALEGGESINVRQFVYP